MIKNIEGYDGYRISDKGEVFNGDEMVEPFLHKTRNVHYVKLINKTGVGCTHHVARLVYETFVGKIEDTYKLKYKDMNPYNYKLDNLEIFYRFKKAESKVDLELDKTKQWKPLIGYENLYKISDHGDVYGLISKQMVKPSSDKGYFDVTLTKDRKKKSLKVYHLVFKTFIKQHVDHSNVIDHINRNKLDNRVINLREVTRSENAKNVDTPTKRNFDPIDQYDKTGKKLVLKWKRIDEILLLYPNANRDTIIQCCGGHKKSAYGYVWKYRDYVYDKSEYVQIKTNDGLTYSNYLINKEGKVINQHGRPIKFKLNVYYHTHICSDSGLRKSFPIHRLVASTFIPNPDNKPIVNHIDENKLNNNVNNLEWTDHVGNTTHSLGKKVQQIDLQTGEVVATYNSTVEAFNTLNPGALKGNAWGIGRACKGKQETALGYKWKFMT